MMIRRLQSLVAAVMVLTAAGAANADYPHSPFRWIGIGWSDGYHSHYGCPPKGHAMARQGGPAMVESPASAPWWMSPANGVEQLPKPAPSLPSREQPLDGSSVVGPGSIRR